MKILFTNNFFYKLRFFFKINLVVFTLLSNFYAVPQAVSKKPEPKTKKKITLILKPQPIKKAIPKVKPKTPTKSVAKPKIVPETIEEKCKKLKAQLISCPETWQKDAQKDCNTICNAGNTKIKAKCIKECQKSKTKAIECKNADKEVKFCAVQVDQEESSSDDDDDDDLMGDIGFWSTVAGTGLGATSIGLWAYDKYVTKAAADKAAKEAAQEVVESVAPAKRVIQNVDDLALGGSSRVAQIGARSVAKQANEELLQKALKGKLDDAGRAILKRTIQDDPGLGDDLIKALQKKGLTGVESEAAERLGKQLVAGDFGKEILEKATKEGLGEITEKVGLKLAKKVVAGEAVEEAAERIVGGVFT